MTYYVYNCNDMVLQYIFSFKKRFREKYSNSIIFSLSEICQLAIS
jgi:hypothetical protein